MKIKTPLAVGLGVTFAGLHIMDALGAPDGTNHEAPPTATLVVLTSAGDSGYMPGVVVRYDTITDQEIAIINPSIQPAAVLKSG